MFTLFNYCKSRYNADNNPAEHMTAETRQSLTQKIVETLQEGGGDEEEGSENVEEMLDHIETDLNVAEQQLASLEGKEQFLAVRIAKYQSLLKQQGDHLNQLQKNIDSNPPPQDDDDDDDDDTSETADALAAERLHYQEQLSKSQQHREALGKVVDVHLTILKSIKDCKRTIAALEQKKYELQNVTKKCREFLIQAEEVEREQQLGVEGGQHDLDLTMEMAPMVGGAAAPDAVEEEDQRQSIEEKADATTCSRTADEDEDEGEEEHVVNGNNTKAQESTGLLNDTTSAKPSSLIETGGAPTNVEPLELTA